MFCLQFVMVALRIAAGGFAVCPATELGNTKSGSQNDTLFVDVAGRFWAGGLLRTLHSRCAAPEDSLSGGLQLQQYEQGFHDASTTLGLQRLRAVPHSVRHTGPSEDAFHKRADLAANPETWSLGFAQIRGAVLERCQIASPAFFLCLNSI